MRFFKDIWLRVTSERKSQVIAVVVLGCILWLVFGDSGRRNRLPPQQREVNVGANDPKEQWQDLIERFDTQLTQLKSMTGSQQKEIDDIKKSMQDYEATTAEIFKKVLERLAEVQNANSNGGNGAGGDQTDIGNTELASMSPMNWNPLLHLNRLKFVLPANRPLENLHSSDLETRYVSNS